MMSSHWLFQFEAKATPSAEAISTGNCDVDDFVVAFISNSKALPAAATMTLNSDDTSILQGGGECLRAFLSVGGRHQLEAWRDESGNNGLSYVFQVRWGMRANSACISFAYCRHQFQSSCRVKLDSLSSSLIGKGLESWRIILIWLVKLLIKTKNEVTSDDDGGTF